MPLVRFPVRNEFALGQPGLYKGAPRDDPKALLDGVAVAGLVGVLRQIGDLAEFAAEVFHGLQEQVMSTASRSHKLRVRLQRIEAELSPLEKVLLAQTSRLHFAYTAGSEWHPCIQNTKGHFITGDLPQFIMDPYEECHGPPRLYLLDKFDTGGPGSCLKRYSDPTFFKRASNSFSEQSHSKKEKKVHKIKRQKSSLQKGELSCAESIFNCSSRIRFTSPIVSGQSSSRHAYQIISDQTSASQTASIFDITEKSDSGNHLSSRIEPAYVKCTSNSGSSMEPKERKSKEESPRLMDHKVIIASKFPVAKALVTNDSSSHSSSSEQVAPSFSCITADEKAEIVEAKTGNCSRDEVLAMNIDADAQAARDSYQTTVDQMQLWFNDVSIYQSISSGNEVEEIESETDNYVDALNTIELESEYEKDCNAKQEVGQRSSDVIYQTKEHGMQLPTSNHTENPPLGRGKYCLDHKSKDRDEAIHILSGNKVNHDLSTAESPATPIISATVGIYGHLSDSVPSQNVSNVQTAQSCSAPHSPATVVSKSSEIIDRTMSEPRDRMTENEDGSQDSHNESCSNCSIGFWTNGGILGLEPSKPPDFAITNSRNLNYLAKSSDTVSDVNFKLMTQYGDPMKNAAPMAQKPERIEELQGSSATKASCPRDGLDGMMKLSSDSCSRNSPHHALEGDLRINTLRMPVNPDVEFLSGETDAVNDIGGHSTNIFVLGNKLLSVFEKNVPAVSYRGSEVVSRQRDSMDLLYGHQSISSHRSHEPAFKEKIGRGSPMNSLPSSPPLEHMKISFKPMKTHETSKLFLKFHEGNRSQESIADLYASFQLIPEPVLQFHGVKSDSDDDTFCKSSPPLSDDCPSSYSGYSEQWDSNGTPKGKDPEIYDTFRRISLTDSVYSEKDGEATNNNTSTDNGFTSNPENPALCSVSVCLPDFPSFHVSNHIVQEETKCNSILRNPLEMMDFGPPIAQLPPPPPSQWCVSRTPSGVGKEKKHSSSEYCKNELNTKFLGTTMSLKPLPVSANVLLVGDEPKKKKLQERKEPNEARIGNIIDGKEDFLQQIRTTSFNLRPMVRAETRASVGSIARFKMTTILEKANAIRQAVGSDDEEDEDDWSDT